MEGEYKIMVKKHPAEINSEKQNIITENINQEICMAISTFPLFLGMCDALQAQYGLENEDRLEIQKDIDQIDGDICSCC